MPDTGSRHDIAHPRAPTPATVSRVKYVPTVMR